MILGSAQGGERVTWHLKNRGNKKKTEKKKKALTATRHKVRPSRVGIEISNPHSASTRSISTSMHLSTKRGGRGRGTMRVARACQNDQAPPIMIKHTHTQTHTHKPSHRRLCAYVHNQPPLRPPHRQTEHSIQVIAASDKGVMRCAGEAETDVARHGPGPLVTGTLKDNFLAVAHAALNVNSEHRPIADNLRVRAAIAGNKPKRLNWQQPSRRYPSQKQFNLPPPPASQPCRRDTRCRSHREQWPGQSRGRRRIETAWFARGQGQAVGPAGPCRPPGTHYSHQTSPRRHFRDKSKRGKR